MLLFLRMWLEKQAGRGCHPNSASEPGWKNGPGLEQELRGELDSKCPQLKALLISPIRNNWIKLCASKMGFLIYVVYCFLQSLEQHLAYNGHLIYAGQTKQSINTAISKFSKKLNLYSVNTLIFFLSMLCLQNQKYFYFEKQIYGMIFLCKRCREETWKEILKKLTV